jgi:hypothetical protein
VADELGFGLRQARLEQPRKIAPSSAAGSANGSEERRLSDSGIRRFFELGAKSPFQPLHALGELLNEVRQALDTLTRENVGEEFPGDQADDPETAQRASSDPNKTRRLEARRSS